MAELPEEPQPFDPQALCPKCGFNDTSAFPQITYCWDDNCVDAEVGEHLHQDCTTCGYQWTVLPITDEILERLTKEQNEALEEEQRMSEERKQVELETMKQKVKQPDPNLEETPPAKKKPAPVR